MVVLHLEPATKKLPSTVLTEAVNGSKMTAKAILICRPNSHPFQDRTLHLDQPVKVGRSVARARPAPNNAIFDCKVLSRNHALLWYENGKFFLQDTKSSNGTFVNNQRLSKGSEESTPREVCSGDIVQFGVDVMENSRKGKVTHGCIVATLKIYLPDGKEAKASPSTAVLPPLPTSGTIPTQDLYQLAQYLQEALHREQMLEDKLTTLQNLVGNSQESSQSGWKVLIDEDRLLTRLEILENQLQTYSKNFPDDKLREEVAKLQEDKNKYQSSAKDSLQKVLHEKLEAVRKLQDVERSLTNAESECAHVQEMYETLQRDLQEVAEKCNVQMQEIQELNEKLQEAEEKNVETTKALEDEKATLQARLDELTTEESVLKMKIDTLIIENTAAKEQLLSIRETDGVILTDKIEFEKSITSKDSLQEKEDEIDKLRSQLNETEKELKESRAKIESLQELISHLEEEMKRLQSENSASLIISKNEQNQVNGSPPFNQNHIGEPQGNLTNSLKMEMEKLKEEVVETNFVVHQFDFCIVILKELLTETRDSKTQVEAELTRYKVELEEARTLVQKHSVEASTLRQSIQGEQEQMDNKAELVVKLQDQLTKLESSNKQQLGNLKEKLADEIKRAAIKEEEVVSLRQQLLEANQNFKRSHNEAEQLKQKLKTYSEESELKASRSARAGSPHPAILDNKSAEDYLSVKEECTSLKNRIHAIEAEMRKTRNENSKLQSDYKKLQDSYQELEALKLRIEMRESNEDTRPATVVQENAEGSRTEESGIHLTDAQDEILKLKLQYSQCNEEKVKLKERLENLSEEYQMLSYQTRTISACSILPLILLALSVVLAFYPTLASITATTESPHPP